MKTYIHNGKVKEYMLHAEEIAIWAGIYTLDDTPATDLVNDILQDYISKLDYYGPKYRLIEKRLYKVYSITIYSEALKAFAQELLNKYGDIAPYVLQYEINNKTYDFKLKVGFEK